MKKLILLIDDDLNLQKWLKAALPTDLFLVETAENGREGLDMAVDRKPDLIILDWNLPGWNGLDVCKFIKKNESTAHIPLIMLSGYTETQRKIAAFQLGVDDYLAKPFQIEELIARIKAVLRRCGTAPEDIVQLEGITMNLTTYSVLVDKKPLSLTAMEFRLLHMLMKNAGRILTRKHLLEHIWGYAMEISTRTVDVYVRRLRQKLGLRRASNIESLRGLGYRFKGPLTTPTLRYVGLTPPKKLKEAARIASRDAVPALA
jgi:two-component system, OmpR family, alkaline phosphatase synthesis response regulator PhoP